MELWLTFLLGIFLMLGSVIVFYCENNEKFIEFSIALATSVICMLILIDLIPEVIEAVPFVGVFKIFAVLSGIAFGFVLLLILDKFIPDHDEDEKTIHDDAKNLQHIGLISAVALFIHNIVEGMAIYMMATTNMKAAFITSIGVGLHNIPLGMVITTALYQRNSDKKKTLFIVLTVALSTFVGGLIVCFFPVSNYIEILEAISLTLTIGMLIFILFMELIPKMKKTHHPKVSLVGFTLGIILLLITLFLG